MLAPILLTGVSGHRKTSSLRNLDPKTTFIMRSTYKVPVPVQGIFNQYSELKIAGEDPSKWTGNTAVVIEPLVKIKEKSGGYNWEQKITKLYPMLIQMGFKTIVIDDVQILLGSIENMLRLDMDFVNKRSIYAYIKSYITSLINITQMFSSKAQAVLIWQKLPDRDQLVIPGDYYNEVTVPQGSFDIVLQAELQPDGGSLFRVNGSSLSRSPAGMWPENYIPADLAPAIERIREYYGVK